MINLRTLNRGLKVYGKKGNVAVCSELPQGHNKGNFKPQDPKLLTLQEIKNSLESHLFMEQKKNQNCKGRIVVVGNKQKLYVSKQEATPPPNATH